MKILHQIYTDETFTSIKKLVEFAYDQAVRFGEYYCENTKGDRFRLSYTKGEDIIPASYIDINGGGAYLLMNRSEEEVIKILTKAKFLSAK